eukprot:TRINITY_DN161_c0_g1_i1.p1 TRINITY_DN161_c0_g1~~TRINITY_DN161_c0_g1_i1.p1  ORF type:complete len:606 (-),score=142.20 TRINITY_DN161_c0_g1_i1:194-2011(-)
MSATGIHTPDPKAPKGDLDLALIGNCSYGALIDKTATVKWCCLPRFDGDPIFCTLLRKTNDIGFYEISVENFSHSKQYYIKNTGVLRTELYTKKGEAIEVTDFAPRFMMNDRAYRPTMLVRIVKPLIGNPRIQVRIRPTFGYGWGAPEKTRGTNHVRYLLPNFSVRVTTNAPISYVVDEVMFEISETYSFVLMPDESLKEALSDLTTSYLDKTINYWLEYSRVLAIPFEYQEQVLRSCITLKMCSFEETGAMIGSITSSIPNHPGAPGHDLRFCWLRDSSYIVHTFNKLGSTKTMEDFLKFISNIVAAASQTESGTLQPVYGISLETTLYEKDMHRLAGYRGIGPVRVGTKDYQLVQNDVYGHVILATTQMFFDQRLKHMGDKLLFERLEGIGKIAVGAYNQPDAGPTGFSAPPAIHTFSSVMCWAAADRLKKIALAVGQEDKSKYWAGKAEEIKKDVLAKSFNTTLNSYTDTWGGDKVDSHLLLLPVIGFISSSDEKFKGTVARIEKVLKKGKYLHLSEHAQSLSQCSTTATLWYINTIASLGRKDEAKELYHNMLSTCNKLGLLSESVDCATGELWGNFPKSAAMVGLIECAMNLSKKWDEVI